MKKPFLWITLFTLSLWLVLSLFVLPSYATRVANNPVTTTPAQAGITYEDVTIESDGLKLPGWWMPAASPIAELMFIHGAGSNRTSHFIDSLNLYKALSEMGISVLSIDLRNHGNAPKTTGHLTMGLDEHRDVLAMAAWLDARQNTPLPTLVMGASMGGATAVHALANGLAVDGVILFDPALHTADSLAQGAWVNTGLPTSIFQLYAWAGVNFYPLPSGNTDTLELAKALAQPILLIQDVADPVTRLPYAEELAEANNFIDLRLAPNPAENAQCLQGKGRWGSHVAAFRCDNAWMMSVLADYLSGLGISYHEASLATSENQFRP